MTKNSKIYIAGHRGMVGSAIIRKLKKDGYEHLICKNSKELDLRNQRSVEKFFEKEQPEYVFLAAAKVGGIHANNIYPAEFIYDNLMIETNIIHSAYKFGVKKLLFLGSSCIYPKYSKQPIKEEYLLTGSLEETNEAYAIAKIVGLELCKFYRRQYGCDFISAMPTNLYGPNDNFNLNTSHVLPALIRKIHEAKIENKDEVIIWGTGTAKREFLHVDDLAEACYLLMMNYSEEAHINIGAGEDIEILELTKLIKTIIGFTGKITHDLNKPDGTPKKLMDITKIKKLNYHNKISLKEGIRTTYLWALKNKII